MGRGRGRRKLQAARSIVMSCCRDRNELYWNLCISGQETSTLNVDLANTTLMVRSGHVVFGQPCRTVFERRMSYESNSNSSSKTSPRSAHPLKRICLPPIHPKAFAQVAGTSSFLQRTGRIAIKSHAPSISLHG